MATNKICTYSPEKKDCIERYKSCYYYSQNTFEDDRNREECYDADYWECSSVTIFNDDNTVDTSRICAEEDYECYIKEVERYSVSKCFETWPESTCIHSATDYRKRCFRDNKRLIKKQLYKRG